MRCPTLQEVWAGAREVREVFSSRARLRVRTPSTSTGRLPPRPEGREGLVDTKRRRAREFILVRPETPWVYFRHALVCVCEWAAMDNAGAVRKRAEDENTFQLKPNIRAK